MHFVVQFPLADSRTFLQEETGHLVRPVWPTPNADHDFIRSIGIVRERPRGGLTGWVSENVFCQANRAIQFQGSPNGLPQAELNFEDPHLSIGIAYKRFFSDGYAVAKFEIGFTIRSHSEEYALSHNDSFEKLARHILNLRVRIRDSSGKVISGPLLQAGKHLARLYLFNTTKTEWSERKQPNIWWVEPCKPVLLAETNFLRHFPDSACSVGREVSIDSNLHARLFFSRVTIDNLNLRSWLIIRQAFADHEE